MLAYNANNIIVTTSTVWASVASGINMTCKIALVTAGAGRERREGERPGGRRGGRSGGSQLAISVLHKEFPVHM